MISERKIIPFSFSVFRLNLFKSNRQPFPISTVDHKKRVGVGGQLSLLTRHDWVGGIIFNV